MLCGRKKQFIEWFILTRYGWFKMLSIIQNQKLIRFSSLEKRDQSFIIHHFRTSHAHSWTSLVFYSCSWFQTLLSDLCYSCLNTLSPFLPCPGWSCLPSSASCSLFSAWNHRGTCTKCICQMLLLSHLGSWNFHPGREGWPRSSVGGAVTAHNLQVSRT